MTTSIAEVKKLLKGISSLSDPLFDTLASDSRIGVQKALKARQKAIQAQVDEDLRLEGMLIYERELYKQGFKAIAGIDEVGRGPLAGPVVAVCVVLPKTAKLDTSMIPKK